MKSISIIFIFLFGASCIYSQRDFQVISSSIRITGTSTFHDWQATTGNIFGTASLNMNSQDLESISKLSLKIDASSLKSDQGKWMDKTIYKTLNTDEYPKISFSLKRSKNFSKNKKEMKLKALGELTIAGTTRTVIINALGKKNSNYFKISGSKTIELSAFNIVPPTHMLGTVKAGSSVEVFFEVTFANSGFCYQNDTPNYLAKK
ncbi:MAG: YceI family protein [Bacteroidota bacterium]